jgi:hypothetical protein
MKKALKPVIKVFLLLGTPFTFLSSLWLKLVIKSNEKGKIEDAVFSKLGILPVLDHYYQPLINPRKHLKKSSREDRALPGVDLNISEQLAVLSKFDYNEELLSFPVDKSGEITGEEYFYNNLAYGSGDAEYLYNIIRYFKPRRIIEIGSGWSTLMAQNAINKNNNEDESYQCEHICIEPYERPWLEKKNLKVIGKKVEDIESSFFEQLGPDDILFIDSSHVIRPQGDVLCEYLQILPVLKPGVMVHVHDIFTPRDYPDAWIYKPLLWNEQYLLEAFLSFNGRFKIIGATNFLSHNYRGEFSAKCPVFSKQPGREPGAFWMKRV